MDDELSFRAGDFTVIRPYTTDKSEDGRSARVSFSIPLEMSHMLSVITANPNTPYLTHAEIGRDALAKWLDVLIRHTHLPPSGSLTWFQREKALIDDGRDAMHRREVDRSVEYIAESVHSMIKRHDTEEMIKQLGRKIGLIESYKGDIDPYWQQRWKHKLTSSRHVQEALRYLESTDYHEHPVVLTLERWLDEVSGKGHHDDPGIEHAANSLYRNGKRPL